MLDLTLEKAKSLIQEAIAERGADYIYERPNLGCAYVQGEEYDYDLDVHDLTAAMPSCGVGLALFKGGISLEDMFEMNNEGATDLLYELERTEVVKATPEAIAYLQAFQGSQDNGIPWGESAKLADRGLYRNAFGGDSSVSNLL